jgi:hypothetical protein
MQNVEGERRPVRITTLHMKLGAATEFEIHPDFNEKLPPAVRCKTCSRALFLRQRTLGAIYRHPTHAYGWCKPELAVSIHLRPVLAAVLRAVLERAPAEPDKTLYDRVSYWVRDVYVLPIGAGQFAIEVQIRPEQRQSAA